MNKIQKTTLHPVGDNSVDLYPTTSSDQVVDLVEFLNKQGLNPKPFVVGDVTTLPAGEDAKVTFTESNDKIAINFYIPMGQRGIQGNAGDTGREGPVGPRGPSGNDFQIKLQVDSAEDLPTASSAYLGWAAYVGTETPRDVWACVEISEGVIAWENQGQLQGAKGDTGNGVTDFTLVSHVVVGDETYNTIQVSYTDKAAETFEIHAKNGQNGENGQNGSDGNKIYTQAVPPTDFIANEGDIYIDVSTWNFYSFTNGSWRLDGNIKGEKGDSSFSAIYRHDIRLALTDGDTNAQTVYLSMYNNKPSPYLNFAALFSDLTKNYVCASGQLKLENLNMYRSIQAIGISYSNNLKILTSYISGSNIYTSDMELNLSDITVSNFNDTVRNM